MQRSVDTCSGLKVSPLPSHGSQICTLSVPAPCFKFRRLPHRRRLRRKLSTTRTDCAWSSTTVSRRPVTTCYSLLRQENYFYFPSNAPPWCRPSSMRQTVNLKGGFCFDWGSCWGPRNYEQLTEVFANAQRSCSGAVPTLSCVPKQTKMGRDDEARFPLFIRILFLCPPPPFYHV